MSRNGQLNFEDNPKAWRKLAIFELFLMVFLIDPTKTHHVNACVCLGLN